MSHYNDYERDLSQNAQSELDREGEKIKNRFVDTAKNGAKKATRKLSKKAAAKVSKAKIASALTATFASIKTAVIAMLAAIGWPLLLIILLLLVLTFFIWVGFEVYYNESYSGGNYQTESISEQNERTFSGTKVTDIQSSIGYVVYSLFSKILLLYD